MKRRLFLSFFIFALTLCASLSTVAFATETETQAADALYELGLFKGTGTNADGTPIYSLEKTPSRAEAITMLVRLLGKEKEATAKTWETPFTDVDAWAKPYVGYAYNNGLTNGISATSFGSNQNSNATQYLSFVLRSLGYSDKSGDFAWDKAWELTDELGITNGEYNAKSLFNRGNVVEVSYAALSANEKGKSTTLLDKLKEQGVIDSSQELEKIGTTTVAEKPDTINTFQKPQNEEIVISGDFKLQFYDDVMGFVLRKYEGNAAQRVDIPAYVNGYPVVEISFRAFRNVDTIFIPSTVTNYVDEIEPLDQLKEVIVDENNTFLSVEDGCLLCDGGKTVVTICGKDKKELAIPKGVEVVRCTLQGAHFSRVIVPSTTKQLGQKVEYYNPWYYNTIEEFVVDEDNPYFTSIDGVLYSKNEKRLIAYPCYNSRETFVVPDTVTDINAEAFRSARYLKDLYIPDSVTFVGKMAVHIKTEWQNAIIVHCEPTTKPAGWDDSWYVQYDYKSVTVRPVTEYVLWGVSRDEFP